jgi:predicted Rdx family selenoprotein
VQAATTSCAFAQNVFLAYWMDQDSPGVFAGEPGLPAYSPAADRMFTVSCSGDPVVCKAGDGGYVTFPMTAVDAYTMADAKRYAAAHDTGVSARPTQGVSARAPRRPPARPPTSRTPAPMGAIRTTPVSASIRARPTTTARVARETARITQGRSRSSEMIRTTSTGTVMASPATPEHDAVPLQRRTSVGTGF